MPFIREETWSKFQRIRNTISFGFAIDEGRQRTGDVFIQVGDEDDGSATAVILSVHEAQDIINELTSIVQKAKERIDPSIDPEAEAKPNSEASELYKAILSETLGDMNQLVGREGCSPEAAAMLMAAIATREQNVVLWRLAQERDGKLEAILDTIKLDAQQLPLLFTKTKGEH